MSRPGAMLVALACCGCAARGPYTWAGGPIEVMVVRSEPVVVDGEPVMAAADDGTRRLLLTAQSAWIFRGSTAERTPGARPWHKAALIPAADGRGTWGVGLDQEGRLWRVRPGAELEEISDRYGLGQERIRDVAAAGGRLVAFLIDGALAVADGRRVLRFPAAGARTVVGGGRLVALVFADRLVALDFSRDPGPQQRSYPIEAIAAGVDARGALFAATTRAVYRAEAGTLRLRYLAGARIRWLTAAGPRVWFADGDTLLASDDSITAAQGATAPASAAVAASDGALWALDRGRPARIVPDHASAMEERWLAQVRPIFTSACSECHRRDGKSGVDLSTAAAWLEARDEIRERVVTRRTMPPAGRALSEDDRATIAAWMRGS